MRVLFACHRLPYPPKRGGKIRPFNIIRHLSESGFSVSVATLARSEKELEEGCGLTEYCDRLLVGSIGRLGAATQMVGRLATLSPSSMGYFFSRDLHRSVGDELRRNSYDLVFAHCSSAAQYLRTSNGVPSIIDFGDMDSQKWRDYASFKPFPLSLGYRLEAAKLCREEKQLAGKFDVSTCTTRAELDVLNGFSAAHRTDWFPNGVDTDFFVPTARPYDRDSLAFIGRMDYYPNQQAMLQFCEAVLPAVQAKRPGTTLTIIGAEPSRAIRALGRLPGVTVTGTVPDVRDYVRRSAVSVAPLRIARGTQNKILESMAMGVPVVCTSRAAKGVDARPGEHLITADSSEEWVRAVVELLEQPDLRARMARVGRERVLTHHSWKASMQKLDRIVRSVVSPVPAPKVHAEL